MTSLLQSQTPSRDLRLVIYRRRRKDLNPIPIRSNTPPVIGTKPGLVSVTTRRKIPPPFPHETLNDGVDRLSSGVLFGYWDRLNQREPGTAKFRGRGCVTEEKTGPRNEKLHIGYLVTVSFVLEIYYQTYN